MFSTVRYFIKTSILFLIVGIFTGLYLSFSKYVWNIGYSPEIASAHTHLILVGSVMMMIMGVALWFFPRPTKDDKRYNHDLILITYWTMAISTALRFIFQVLLSFIYLKWISTGVTIFSTFQIIAIILFFYSIWGRIRSVGSYKREKDGEKF